MEDNVIDLGAEKENKENTEVKQVLKGDFDELMGIGSEIEQAYLHAGNLEFRKFEVMQHIQNMRRLIDTKARTAIINAGVEEADAENYKIDLQTGNIVPR